MDITQVTRVGCKRDARKALKGLLQPIGRGAYRRTYRDARGEVAYKVCMRWDDTPALPDSEGDVYDDANRDEYVTVRDCRATYTGQNYVLPTSLWVIDGVAIVAQPMLAMTAADVRDDPATHSDHEKSAAFWQTVEEINLAAEELGVGCDMHMKNWGFDQNGRPWMFDLNLSEPV